MQADWNFRLGPLRFRSRATWLGALTLLVMAIVCFVIVPCAIGAGL